MKSLTDIISELEKIQRSDVASGQYYAILALAIHLKNLENKLKGLESQRNNGIVDAIATEWAD